MYPKHFRNFLAYFVLFVTVAGCSADSIEIVDGWVADAPPSSRVRAGYFQIANDTGSDKTLVGADSEMFGSVEIHETVAEGGMMKMRPLEQLVLKNGERAAFEPGGKHLMLMMPKGDMPVGTTVPIVLRFSDGETFTAQFKVRTRDEAK